jgi:hypothetical protein
MALYDNQTQDIFNYCITLFCTCQHLFVTHLFVIQITVPVLASWISKDFKKLAYPIGVTDKGNSKIYKTYPFPKSDGNWAWHYIRRFWIDGMWG